MKSYCIRDTLTGAIFKTFGTEESLNKYLSENPDMKKTCSCQGCGCTKYECVECDDAPSILIE